MRILFIAFGLVVSSVGAVAARPYDEIMKAAQTAYATEDYAAAGALLDEAQAQQPYSLFLTRNRILTRLLTDRTEDALAIAREIAEKGLVLELPSHEAFEGMKNLPDYAPIAAKMSENAKPFGAADIVVEFADNAILPEAISLHKKRMLIGSVRNGEIRNASSGLAPFAKLDGGVFDVEQTETSVFAAVNNQLAFERRSDMPAFAAISELDGRTGAERRRISVASDALIGDIEIDAKGNLYASDSLNPRLFVASASDSEARVFKTDDRWANPQGIALDRKRGRLYLADYLTGLFFIDLNSGAVVAIGNPTNAHLGGIDGLYLYRGDLIGVQNGTSPQRVVRVRLDKTGAIATRLDVLARALDGWNEPTHGVVVGREFYYIATSNWPAYDDEGALRQGAQLSPLRVMSLRLN